MHDVGGVQERGALEADVDERGLHARQHARNAALVDVADESAAIGALEKDLLQHAVLDQRRAHLARTDIDQNFGGHPCTPRRVVRASGLNLGGVDRPANRTQQLGGLDTAAVP